VRSYVLDAHDGGNVGESALMVASFDEPRQKGSFMSDLVSIVSFEGYDSDADERGDYENDYTAESDERLAALEPSDSVEIPDIEVEFGKSRDVVISFPDGTKSCGDIVLVKSPSRAGASIGKSRSFLGSILKSPSRGESIQPSTSLNQEPSGLGLDDDDDVMLVKSPSRAGARIGKSRSFLGSILNSPSRGESIQPSTSLKQEPSGLGLAESPGIAIQASPSQIAKGQEVKDGVNHQEDAMSIGIQASPSKIARGDDPTVISDHGVGFEVEIKPTSCLLTPHSDGDKKKEDMMSHTSTITHTAAAESIPSRIDVQTKGKGTKNLSRLEYYRQLGAAKATKPKKPGRNIFGLRRKGDPYYSDKAAAKKANKAFLGLRPSSKVKPSYRPENQGNLSKLRKSSGITKSTSNKDQGGIKPVGQQAWEELCFLPMCFANEVEEETPEFIADEKEMCDTCCVFPTFIFKCVQEDLAFDPDSLIEEEFEREYLESKATKNKGTPGKPRTTMSSKPSHGSAAVGHQSVAKNNKDDESWSIPISTDARTIGSTSLFDERGSQHDEPKQIVATEAREPTRCNYVCNDKSVISSIIMHDNAATLSGVCMSGLSEVVSSADQWPSVIEDAFLQDGGRGDDQSVTSKGVVSLSGMVDYVTELIKVEDGIDDIANIVQSEADIQGMEGLAGEPKTDTGDDIKEASASREHDDFF
jgi:hypothetical protein